MGVIILISSFDFTGYTAFISNNPKWVIYEGFEASWYKEMGAPLCVAIFLSAFATNFNECQKMGFKEMQRIVDRGFKPNLKKDVEDEDDDEPNTKMAT